MNSPNTSNSPFQLLSRETLETRMAFVMEFAKTKRLLEPGSETEYFSIPGGIVVYGGPQSPHNHVLGFGLFGTEEESLARAQAFFWPKLSPFCVELSPWIGPEAQQILGSKNFKLTETCELWSLKLQDSDPRSMEISPTVATSTPPNQHKLWALHLTQAINELVPWDPVETFLTYGQMPSVHKYIAISGGLVAGGAALFLRKETAFLFGAAIKPEYRGKGLFDALIDLRLLEARRFGASLAFADVESNSSASKHLSEKGFTKVAQLHRYSQHEQARSGGRSNNLR